VCRESVGRLITAPKSAYGDPVRVRTQHERSLTPYRPGSRERVDAFRAVGSEILKLGPPYNHAGRWAGLAKDWLPYWLPYVRRRMLHVRMRIRHMRTVASHLAERPQTRDVILTAIAAGIGALSVMALLAAMSPG
jgi:hypothetical protein